MKYYTIQETAELLGTSKQAVWQKLKRRRITPFDTSSIEEEKEVPENTEYYLNEVDVKMLIIALAIEKSYRLQWIGFDKLKKILHKITN